MPKTPQRLGWITVRTDAPTRVRSRYLLIRRHVLWRLTHPTSFRHMVRMRVEGIGLDWGGGGGLLSISSRRSRITSCPVSCVRYLPSACIPNASICTARGLCVQTAPLLPQPAPATQGLCGISQRMARMTFLFQAKATPDNGPRGMIPAGLTVGGRGVTDGAPIVLRLGPARGPPHSMAPPTDLQVLPLSPNDHPKGPGSAGCRKSPLKSQCFNKPMPV